MVPSSSSKPPSAIRPLSHRSPSFTPIREGERDEQEDDGNEEAPPSKHHPTPAHRSTARTEKPSTGKRTEKSGADPGEDDRTVSCNKCRPSAREKISVVPIDNSENRTASSIMASPSGILRSILTSITGKSPKPSLPGSGGSSTATRDEDWKTAVSELSHKLTQTTRKRDEAILEASRLKYSMSELEKKLNKLEIYCHDLKHGLEVCNSNNSPYHRQISQTNRINDDKVIEHFLISVSESRTAIRLLSRALTSQTRQIGGGGGGSKLHEPKRFSPKQNPLNLEAALNRTFFEDFETAGFHKSSSDQILNPFERCESNYRSFQSLKSLYWEEVLSKGTKHFSEEFSGFCDRKMSEIVGVLGWSRAWPETLLQAFFGASKSVWLVHLLAKSVHPGLPIFRVENGCRFDPIYMEDVGGGGGVVRTMVAPGFYVYQNVVKCKVGCTRNYDEKGSALSPFPNGF